MIFDSLLTTNLVKNENVEVEDHEKGICVYCCSIKCGSIDNVCIN